MPYRATLTRRQVLRLGLAVGGSCLVPVPALAAAFAPGFGPADSERLMAEFSPVSQGFADSLRAGRQLSFKQAAEIGRQTRLAYARLLPELPFLGAKNPNQTYLVQAAWLTALYQGGRSCGIRARQVGWFFYDANQRELGAMGQSVLAVRRQAFFSQEHRDELARWALWSRLRLYPGDWVGEVATGAGEDFDLGYDMRECGALKFFKAQGVAEIAPYFCLNDFPRSGFEGTGLVRTGTLATGQAVCDFRYKRGRQVTQNWETELTRLPQAYAR